MKPVIMFTVADDKNRPYAEMLAKSLRKFYDAKTLPFRIYGNEDIAKFKDPAFFCIQPSFQTVEIFNKAPRFLDRSFLLRFCIKFEGGLQHSFCPDTGEVISHIKGRFFANISFEHPSFFVGTFTEA